jgi:hypothetical protein
VTQTQAASWARHRGAQPSRPLCRKDAATHLAQRICLVLGGEIVRRRLRATRNGILGRSPGLLLRWRLSGWTSAGFENAAKRRAHLGNCRNIHVGRRGSGGRATSSMLLHFVSLDKTQGRCEDERKSPEGARCLLADVRFEKKNWG